MCLAPILRGCEQSDNVSRTQTVPPTSQDGYDLGLLTTESSSNGNLKTSFDNNAATRTCNRSNKQCKKKRIPVPLEKKDDKYWERRRRNNLAAKRCRESKRRKQLRELQMADKSVQENRRLRAEIRAYRFEVDSLRGLLRDANTTLALCMQARACNNGFDYHDQIRRLPPVVINCHNSPHSLSMSSLQE